MTYDTEADMASLQAIMAYWTGADDYATRVANLTRGNGVPLFDATTVHGNGARQAGRGGLHRGVSARRSVSEGPRTGAITPAFETNPRRGVANRDRDNNVSRRDTFWLTASS
jgi:hypothetical protein